MTAYQGPTIQEVNRAVTWRDVRRKIALLRRLMTHATLKPAEWGIHFLSDGKPEKDARETAMIGRCAMSQTHNVAEVIGVARWGGRPQVGIGDAFLISFAIRSLKELINAAEGRLDKLTDLDLRAECERRGMPLDDTPWTPASIPPPENEDVLLEWGENPDVTIARYSESARLERPDIGGWLSSGLTSGAWLHKPRRWRSIPLPPPAMAA